MIDSEDICTIYLVSDDSHTIQDIQNSFQMARVYKRTHAVANVYKIGALFNAIAKYLIFFLIFLQKNQK